MRNLQSTVCTLPEHCRFTTVLHRTICLVYDSLYAESGQAMPDSDTVLQTTQECSLGSQSVLSACSQLRIHEVGLETSFFHSRPSAPELTRTEWIHNQVLKVNCSLAETTQTRPTPLRSWKRWSLALDLRTDRVAQ